MKGDIKPKPKATPAKFVDHDVISDQQFDRVFEENSFDQPFDFEAFEQYEKELTEEKISETKKIKLSQNKNIFSRPNSIFFTIVTTFFSLALVLFVFSIKSAYSSIQTNSTQMKNRLSELENNFSSNNFDKTIDSIKILTQDSDRLQLALQRLGQDTKLYYYIPGKKSKISKIEITLGACNSLVAATDKYLSEIKASSQSWLGDPKQPDGYYLDLFALRRSFEFNTTSYNNEINKQIRFLKQADNSESLLMRDKLALVQEKISDIDNFISDNWDWISGLDGSTRHYMIIFQNNGELRGASGGSLGSFGIATVSYGKFEKIDFAQNIYKLNKEFLVKNQIESPEIIKFVSPFWTLKDSGWSIDGPDAFKTIADFYNKETGENVDGIISLDASTVEYLLESTGPIEMTKYNQTITSTNFREIFNQEVHETYFTREGAKEENEPKKIISDMLPIMTEKIMTSIKTGQNVASLAQSLQKSLKEKHIIVYAKNEKVQKELEQNNLAGKINANFGDFLYVNNSNINGGKSSLSVNENINLSVNIAADGTKENDLTIERNCFKQSDATNINFVRLALPEKTQVSLFEPVTGNFQQYFTQGLKDGKYFWTTEEFNKKVVNYWMSTEQDKSSKVHIKYDTNLVGGFSSEGFEYSLMVQRQPGALAPNLNLTLDYPDGYYPVNVKTSNKESKIALHFNVNEDKTIKIKFKKK